MIEAIFLGTLFPLLFLIIILKGENRLIMLFFTWGLVAFALSLTINNTLVNQYHFDFVSLSVTYAPVIEEFIKAFPLIYFLLKRKKTNFPYVNFAVAAGIGFSIQENYVYLLGNIGATQTTIFYIILRSVTSCLMHGMTTGIIGYGLMLIRKFKKMIWQLLFGLFTLSVTIHSLFNLYINSNIRIIGMMIPVLLYMIGLVVLNSISEEKSESN
jgi:RsiW-degrading membrane proteinase PrsW (M82 family)